jgi:hypothetical protein
MRKFFFFASWKSLTKRARSRPGAGSLKQVNRSKDPDPDPYLNVMDPEHWFSIRSETKITKKIILLLIFCFVYRIFRIVLFQIFVSLRLFRFILSSLCFRFLLFCFDAKQTNKTLFSLPSKTIFALIYLLSLASEPTMSGASYSTQTWAQSIAIFPQN